MAAINQKVKALLEFFSSTFRAPELEMFLAINGYGEVAADVSRNVGDREYFFHVGQALHRRRLIDDVFFDRLETERPARSAEIRQLAKSWMAAGSGALTTSDHDDVYRSIVESGPAIRDHAIDFGGDLAAADRFVGRSEFFRRLEDFAKKRPCGYLRVVADAGLGKTALAAATAKRRKAPAFFANASRGLTRPEQCLNHLAVELIARFGLDHDHLPARSGEDSAFLGRVLAEAAAKAAGSLWIVVDALDEADPPGPGRNPLLLPDRLPRGVFAPLTHRPAHVALATTAGTANEEYSIAASDPAQQADIEAYLGQEADQPEIRRAREAANPPIAIDRFVAFLKEKERGEFQVPRLRPGRHRRGRAGFRPAHARGAAGRPAGLLSAVLEPDGAGERSRGLGRMERPVSPDDRLPGCGARGRAGGLAGRHGRPTSGGDRRAGLATLAALPRPGAQARAGMWRVVHQSFVDFLAGERKADLRAAHDRVATFYLTAWGGLDAGLPALFDPAPRDPLDNYGLRHLAEHLEHAGRIDELHDLFRLERRVGEAEIRSVRAENAWYAARERVGQTVGFLNDLARAARRVQLAVSPGIPPGEPINHIGPEIRYALISASIKRLAGNIPPALIAVLVEKGVWLASQGLDYARVLPPERTVEAMIEISSRLDHHEMVTVLREARDAARGIGDEEDRAEALGAIARRLADAGREEEALGLARSISNEGSRARALAELARRMAELPPDKGLALWRGTLRLSATRTRGDLLYDLAALAPLIAALGGPDAIAETCRAIEDIGRWWP